MRQHHVFAFRLTSAQGVRCSVHSWHDAGQDGEQLIEAVGAAIKTVSYQGIVSCRSRGP